MARLKERRVEEPPCAVDVTLRVIGGRWKVLILQELFLGTRRFSVIQRTISGITQKMLTQQLREMEAHGVVDRLVYAQVPPKVEYSLTPLGESLWPVLMAMHEWGLTQSGTDRSAVDRKKEDKRAPAISLRHRTFKVPTHK